MKWALVCACFALQLFLVSQAIEVRRDENWPPPKMIAFMKPLAMKCREQTGVTEEAIREFSDGEVHHDPALKCYMYCIFKEGGAIRENGEVHLEELADHIESYDDEVQDIFFHMARRCLRPVGDTLCERAFWFHQCWKSYDPKHYFLI